MEEFPFVKNVPRLFQYRKIGEERLEEKGKHLASKLNSGVVCLEEEREQKGIQEMLLRGTNGRDRSKRLEFFLLLTFLL